MRRLNSYKQRTPDVQAFNINTASPGGFCSCDRTVFRLNSPADRAAMVVVTSGGVAYGFKLERDDHSMIEASEEGV